MMLSVFILSFCGEKKENFSLSLFFLHRRSWVFSIKSMNKLLHDTEQIWATYQSKTQLNKYFSFPYKLGIMVQCHLNYALENKLIYLFSSYSVSEGICLSHIVNCMKE